MHQIRNNLLNGAVLLLNRRESKCGFVQAFYGRGIVLCTMANPLKAAGAHGNRSEEIDGVHE